MLPYFRHSQMYIFVLMIVVVIAFVRRKIIASTLLSKLLQLHCATLLLLPYCQVLVAHTHRHTHIEITFVCMCLCIYIYVCVCLCAHVNSITCICLGI